MLSQISKSQFIRPDIDSKIFNQLEQTIINEKMTTTNRQPSQNSIKRNTNSTQSNTDLQKIEVGSGA